MGDVLGGPPHAEGRVGGALAFYAPHGRAFAATDLTRGPWDAESQHAGPPCALLGRAVERAGAIAGARVARITFEILKPVPIATLACTAEVVRPGRTVELIEGALSHDGADLIRARAWRIRASDGARAADGARPADGARAADGGRAEQPPADDAPAGPQEAAPGDYFPVEWEAGYHSAMDVRFLAGGYTEAGPAIAWMRMRVPLIEGEQPSPLDRVLVAADSGNGVSGPLDYRRYVFINADLSVALHRLPRGEWVCLDAVTRAEPDGVGLSDTTLLDEDGPIGRATQSLVVRERPEPLGPSPGPERTNAP